MTNFSQEGYTANIDKKNWYMVGGWYKTVLVYKQCVELEKLKISFFGIQSTAYENMAHKWCATKSCSKLYSNFFAFLL